MDEYPANHRASACFYAHSSHTGTHPALFGALAVCGSAGNICRFLPALPCVELLRASPLLEANPLSSSVSSAATRFGLRHLLQRISLIAIFGFRRAPAPLNSG
jgi:hypothetical protein